MGITIHFRGTIDDPACVEEFEDRILDVAFVLGGRARIWRSYGDHDPLRIVRGLMLELSPGQETTSLLLSPEGQLIGLMQIEESEQRALDEAPWCSVKTQFGSVDGHAAIVELLSMMKQTWFSDLKVSDESGYWDHRDPVRLAAQMTLLRNAIHEMGNALTHFGLSPEAAEDPEILISRIQRVAALVAQKLSRPFLDVSPSTSADSQEESSEIDSDISDESDLSFEESVAQAQRDDHRRQLRSERIMRRVREQLAKGVTHEESLRIAMESEGLPIDVRIDETETPESWESDDSSWRDTDAESAWQPQKDFEQPADSEIVSDAKALLLEVMQRTPETQTASNFFSIAQQGLLDMLGGLVQATSNPDCRDEVRRRLDIVQLKRALKGAEFVRGAVFGLRSSHQFDQSTCQRWQHQLSCLIDQTQELLADAWNGPENPE